MFIFHWEKGFPVFLCSRRVVYFPPTYRLSVQRDDETEREKERDQREKDAETERKRKRTACGSILTQGRRETLRRRWRRRNSLFPTRPSTLAFPGNFSSPSPFLLFQINSKCTSYLNLGAYLCSFASCDFAARQSSVAFSKHFRHR